MIKKIIFNTLILASLSSLALADSNQSLVAVADVEQILFESLAGKDLTKNFEQNMEKFQKKYQEKEKSFQSERDDIQKKQSVLSKEAFEKLVKDFQEKVQEMQKNAQNEHRVIEQARVVAYEEIDGLLKSITKDLANKKGFKVALPLAAVVYLDDSLDITKDILVEMNKKMTKVKFVLKPIKE